MVNLSLKLLLKLINSILAYNSHPSYLKEALIGQIVLSGILPIPVMGGKGQEYRNCRRMAINTQVQEVCMEEGVGFVDMWLKRWLFMRDEFHLTGKGAAVLVDDGTGTINYLN